MFTDTHCHLFSDYYEDIDEVIHRACLVGVTRFIVSGCDGRSNEEVVSLTLRHSNVYGVVGLHPECADTYSQSDLDSLEEYLKQDKIIAIGEIGLDYHYTKENKDAQKRLFTYQLELALKYHLPVVIHSREATFDTIQILKKYPDVKGVIHSFSGSLETANIYIKMGYKLGINGVVTFKNSNLKEIIPSILSSIVLETDSPYLTPHPYRGSKNEPQYVFLIAKFLEEFISLEDLSLITNQNIHEIFDI